MRIKALLLVAAGAAALAATAMPASAQSYSRNCNAAKTSNQVGGAILGGILGGVLGSNVAADGHRHDGTAVGAVLGGLVGAGVGSGTDCRPQPQQGRLPPPPGTYAPGYSNYPDDGYADRSYDDGYNSQPAYDYGPAPVSAYPSDPGYSTYGDDRYLDGAPSDRGRGYGGSWKHGNDRDNQSLYPDDNQSYKRNDNYAGGDCTTATQITRLPDGTVIRRPVEACRDAYYGDWQVRN